MSTRRNCWTCAHDTPADYPDNEACPVHVDDGAPLDVWQRAQTWTMQERVIDGKTYACPYPPRTAGGCPGWERKP